MNWRRVRAMARKEMLHIVRDPRSLGMALAVPVVMLLLFGVALSLDVDRIPTQIIDRDQTPESRDFAKAFEGSRYFDVLSTGGDIASFDRAVNRDKILVGVVIPRNFARDLKTGRQARIQFLVDGSDSNTASIARNYAEALAATYAQHVHRTPPLIDAQVRIWYNSDLKSRNYIVPGLIAVVLMIIAALLTSLTIAREWENGSMEQLLSTPLRPAEIVLGKLAAFFAIGAVDVVTSVLVGVLAFHVPMRGSLLFLAFCSGVFLFGALSWGILISALARTQLLAFQMGLLTSFLPAFLLSGFIYSIDNMPRVIQVVTYIVPARYFVAILKAIYLKGAGLALLWPQFLLLILYAVAVFIASVRTLGRKVA